MVARACPLCRKPVVLPASGTFVCPHCEGELVVRPGKATAAQTVAKIGLVVFVAAVALGVIGVLLASL
jgi:uncharacterized Zn finger protein (UPF0148 family)